MMEKKQPYPHESLPVGRTEEDQERNALLLSGYEYDKYSSALTGFTGQDLQRIAFVKWEPAVRTRVGPRGNYKAGFAQMPAGDLILAVCRDNNDPDPNRRYFNIYIYKSSDLGLTWQQLEHTPLSGKEPCLASLPDGTLVLAVQAGYFGPGAKLDEQPIYRSSDGGKTWGKYIIKNEDYPRNLFVEKDGTLLMAIAVKSDWYEKDTGSPNLLVCRSKDGGKTWTKDEGLFNWDWAGFGENSVIRLKDGRLLAALRRQIKGTSEEGFEDSVITESTDNGKSWSKPRVLVPTGNVHAYLTELEDGRILCAYSNYHVPWGVSAVLSSDGGNIRV